MSPDDAGNVYLIRYEQMAEAFSAMMTAEGLRAVPLVRTNEASGKEYAEEIAQAFRTPEALRLKNRAVSEASAFINTGLPRLSFIRGALGDA